MVEIFLKHAVCKQFIFPTKKMDINIKHLDNVCFSLEINQKFIFELNNRLHVNFIQKAGTICKCRLQIKS